MNLITKKPMKKSNHRNNNISIESLNISMLPELNKTTIKKNANNNSEVFPVVQKARVVASFRALLLFVGLPSASPRFMTYLNYPQCNYTLPNEGAFNEG